MRKPKPPPLAIDIEDVEDRDKLSRISEKLSESQRILKNN